jgi:hypothetical protein
MTASGSRSQMAFERYLSKELLKALGELSQNGGRTTNWWQDVLASNDLRLGIRPGYLNVYAQGQSVFKIGSSTSSGVDREGKPRVELHYKYLLKPSLPADKEYVRFDGNEFYLGRKQLDPAKIVQTEFTPSETVKELAAAARIYSGAEKQGVHEIAQRNHSVIDLEIAFTKTDEEGNKSVPRIDMAALHEEDGKISVRFYEAKLASDTRLRQNSKGEPEIVGQMKKYDDFLKNNEEDIRDAYISVCRILVALGATVSPLVKKVRASPERLSVDTSAKLLVFGYDQDHLHEESLFNKRIKFLEEDGKLAGRIFSSGRPRFNLEKLR